MSRRALCVLGLLLVAASWVAAAGTQIRLEARDLKNQPLSGFRFSYERLKSRATNKYGKTELDLPPNQPAGQRIRIQLLPGSRGAKDWFLVNPEVNIPDKHGAAAVVLMRRSEFRQIAAAARDAPRIVIDRPSELTAEDRKKVLIETAARYGLTAEQLETAIQSFAETEDLNDQGIAAYLEGQYSKAEEFWTEVVERKVSELAEPLQYLGAAQFEQGKYRAAADTFRKAVALRGQDPILLSWLGNSLLESADWTEAEVSMRHALVITEKSFGPEHPNVAAVLNNLSTLLYATNHLAEAETLMRRALAIFERSFGPEHPGIEVLNNLAQLLQDTNRPNEAEPLLDQALKIAEERFGPDHPNVGAILNNLAQLFQNTNRLTEAEPLMRRTLAIFETKLGPDHPRVATALNNLARLLYVTNRLAEAEPLMRRALTIDEKIYEPENPKVAPHLNNLAQLLRATNRLTEAEPLMRCALAILIDFYFRTHHWHPYLQSGIGYYTGLLGKLGKSDDEISVILEELVRSQKLRAQSDEDSDDCSNVWKEK